MEHLQELITRSRIEAEPHVIYSEQVSEVPRETSKEPAVFFLGFQPPEKGEEDAFFDRMNEMSEGLKTTIFTHSSGNTALEA